MATFQGSRLEGVRCNQILPYLLLTRLILHHSLQQILSERAYVLVRGHLLQGVEFPHHGQQSLLRLGVPVAESRQHLEDVGKAGETDAQLPLGSVEQVTMKHSQVRIYVGVPLIKDERERPRTK